MKNICVHQLLYDNVIREAKKWLLWRFRLNMKTKNTQGDRSATGIKPQEQKHLKGQRAQQLSRSKAA